MRSVLENGFAADLASFLCFLYRKRLRLRFPEKIFVRRGVACVRSGYADPAGCRLTRHRIHSGGSRDSALLENVGNSGSAES